MDPGSVLGITLTASFDDAARDVLLVAILPPGWSVVDEGGATVDPIARTATWSLGDLAVGARSDLAIKVRAPIASPADDPAFVAVFDARLDHAGGTAASATADVLIAPALIVEHTILARLAPVTHVATYLSPDVALDGLVRFDSFRIRFQVRNADLAAVAFTPRLEFAAAGQSQFRSVPVGDAVDGVPFYRDVEWRPAGNGRGTVPGPAAEPIPIAALKVADTDLPSQDPVAGRRFLDDESAARVILPPDSYTEIEFAVRVTRDITADEGFQLRITDAGKAIEEAAIATVGTNRKVAHPLSPGQRNGVPVGPPVDAKRAAVSDPDFPLVTPDFVGAAWPESNATPRYRLAIATPAAPDTLGPPAAPFTSPHTPDTSLVSDTCAACHRAHAAQNANLLAEAAPQATMCFTCHDGTGSNLDTKAQYTSPAVPANVAATRSYYQHDATATPAAPNVHVLATDNEFEATSNRHSECADCHNAHNASADVSLQTTTGWTVAGQQTAVSGVAVTNGAAGSTPTYAFLDGTAGSQPTREYEICLKCHSGFTTLLPDTGQPPSQQILDKGVELNPGNASYHPVEAAGKNATPQMAWSLANSSPYKLWNFTTGGTVRCVNCHGDPTKFNTATVPAPGSDLAPHASQYRGLLLQGYRDRLLKDPDEPYDGADFALCYVCHAEAPFRSGTATMTVFDDHDSHISTIAGEGPGGTDIDTPGAGGGNAICAECHFRTHSTAQAVNVGDRSNERLVNFAPNVEPFNGVLKFTKTATGGNCTLVCHGKEHDAEGY